VLVYRHIQKCGEISAMLWLWGHEDFKGGHGAVE